MGSLGTKLYEIHKNNISGGWDDPHTHTSSSSNILFFQQGVLCTRYDPYRSGIVMSDW